MRNNNLLLEKICSIQTEYKILLEKIVDKISVDEISNSILDEISIFWTTNQEIVDLYLRNLYSSQDVYAFTSATFLDLDLLEHYPFMLLGDVHILDDQVSIYANVVSNEGDPDFLHRFKKQIINSVTNNIQILSKYGNHILILPVRSISRDHQILIRKNATNAFLHLFKNKPKSIEEYSATYKTIDDICDGLHDELDKSLILSDADDPSKDFRERLELALQDNLLSMRGIRSDGCKFFTVVYGFICQALDVIFSCATYNFVPYLRFGVAYHYVLLLSSNFSEMKEIMQIIFKCCLARSIYIQFDNTHIQDVDFEEFCAVVKESNFYSDLMSAFPDQSFEKQSAKELHQIVGEKLSEFYCVLDKL